MRGTLKDSFKGSRNLARAFNHCKNNLISILLGWCLCIPIFSDNLFRLVLCGHDMTFAI